MLKFPVKEITSAGLSIKKDVPPSEIGLEEKEVDLRSPLTVEANLTRIDNMIVVDTLVSAQFGYQCARCLTDFQRSKSKEYHFDYEIATPMDIIDVGEDIRQEMILAIPQKVLCSKDCKGICPGCGVNLNTEKCKCKQ